MRAELAAGPWTLERLDRAVDELEAFVFGGGDDAPELIRRLGVETVAELREAYCAWETLLEERFACQAIRARAADYHSYPLSSRFRRLLARELSLAGGPPPQRALFVGSGPLPISAVWLHGLSGARVDCVDHSGHAVRCSRAYLRALGLDERIRVLHGSGEGTDPAGYDLVLVALLAKPKRAILRRLHAAAAPGTRIVCRTSHGLQRLLYEPTDESRAVRPFFEVAGVAVAGSGSADTISSLALRPRGAEVA